MRTILTTLCLAGLAQPSDVEVRLARLEQQHERMMDAMTRVMAKLEASIPAPVAQPVSVATPTPAAGLYTVQSPTGFVYYGVVKPLPDEIVLSGPAGPSPARPVVQPVPQPVAVAPVVATPAPFTPATLYSNQFIGGCTSAGCQTFTQGTIVRTVAGASTPCSTSTGTVLTTTSVRGAVPCGGTSSYGSYAPRQGPIRRFFGGMFGGCGG